MPKWEGCVKIHEGCGGLVRWVEAYDQPGIGYTGQCIHCDVEGIVVEQITPIESGRAKRKIQESSISRTEQEELAEITWDDDQNWEQNQERLRGRIESVL